MPVSILDQLTPEAQMAKSFGTGIQSGLQALAQGKMQQMQRGRTMEGLQALGYSPEMSQGLSQFGPDILKEVVKQRVSSNALGDKKISPAQQKADEEIAGRFSKLVEARNIYNEIGEVLEDPQLQLGVVPSRGVKVAPDWFDPSTEMLDKLSDDAVNAESAGLKGRITNIMYKSIGRTKPGVQHSLKVNKQIRENKVRNLEKELRRLQKDYPRIITEEKLHEALNMIQLEKDPKVIERNGQFFALNPQTGEEVELEKE